MTSRASMLDVPMYSVVDAAHLLELRVDRVRRWLKGYEYVYQATGEDAPSRRSQQPVIQRAGADGTPYASFLDLIDMLFVREFLNAGISLPKLRAALNEVETVLGTRHFARREFWTAGKSIFVQVGDRADALRELGTGGQWAIAPVIIKCAKHIQFDDDSGLARRWFPLGRGERVVLDPGVQYGAPTVDGSRITTEAIADLYRGEGKKLSAVRRWFPDLSPGQIRAALKFEARMSTAA